MLFMAMSITDGITKDVGELTLSGSSHFTSKLYADDKLAAPEMGNKPPCRPPGQTSTPSTEGVPHQPVETGFVMVPMPINRRRDESDSVPVYVREEPSSPPSKDWYDSVAIAEHITGADVVIIHSEKDEKDVHKLKQLLTKFVTLSGGRKLVFFPSIVPQWDEIKMFEAALENSRFKFIYINEHVDDPFLEHQHHRALWNKIQSRDQSIVPVKAHFNVRLPSLLGMFRAIEIGKLLRGKTLEDIDDVGLLKDCDVDKYFFNSVYRMFSTPIPTQSAQPQPAPVQNFVSMLRPNFKYLVDHIDPDNGLLVELYSVGVINHRQMETIKAEKTFYDRNERLLKFMQSKTDDDFEKFVNALRVNDQNGLADYLQSQSSSVR